MQNGLLFKNMELQFWENMNKIIKIERSTRFKSLNVSHCQQWNMLPKTFLITKSLNIIRNSKTIFKKNQFPKTDKSL